MSWEIEHILTRSAARYLRITGWLLIPLYFLMVLALYGAFLYAPTEKVMGEVQRIFYFHVGAAWNAFLAFFGVFLGGLAYLITRKQWWDHLAAASAEIGVVFTTIVLTTGPIWAKPVWNTWWPWGDPRVMTTMVLWLIYIAYLILRSSLPEGEKKYRYCAVFGIIGFLDVPIVWFSIRWWRTIHPLVITGTGEQLEPEMIHALVVSVITFTVLYLSLLMLRMAMRLNSSVAEEVGQRLLEERVERV
ncbi:cytochrome c biogenesis protein [Acidobacteria bacterium AH-259-O06]|nr:cytochrome c biogenesis protein [Acidobacteria bacterium AH-259-O06]